ncbi:mucin-19-like [Mus pahari]|uniref:mucin-19-like n=1 Tax=Mus pahari TaxID=10093 RepID=UPI001114D52C|nr:mucin-19-like [Mus pahari]
MKLILLYLAVVLCTVGKVSLFTNGAAAAGLSTSLSGGLKLSLLHKMFPDAKSSSGSKDNNLSKGGGVGGHINVGTKISTNGVNESGTSSASGRQNVNPSNGRSTESGNDATVQGPQAAAPDRPKQNVEISSSSSSSATPNEGADKPREQPSNLLIEGVRGILGRIASAASGSGDSSASGRLNVNPSSGTSTKSDDPADQGQDVAASDRPKENVETDAPSDHPSNTLREELKEILAEITNAHAGSASTDVNRDEDTVLSFMKDLALAIQQSLSDASQSASPAVKPSEEGLRKLLSALAEEFGPTGTDARVSGRKWSPTTTGTPSTSEKAAHVPEATPTYSEANEVAGEATMWGKDKYKALNGRIFSFESECTLTFCRDCAEPGGDFNIEIKKHKNGDIEEIKALIDEVEILVVHNSISVNEERVQIPFSNKMIHIKKQGNHYELKTRRRMLTLRWGKDKLSLTLYSHYATCGLCGNFNSVPGEDINEHIASSKISNDCPSPLSRNNEVCEDGVQYCDKIIGTYFKKCSKVSRLSHEYKNACVDEYCRTGGGKQTTCDTYSELARLCAYDGPGDYEHWRDDSAVACAKQQCPGKHIYKECGPSNPPTCSNVAPFQDSECVSGCTCPEGYLLDDIREKGKCVLKEKCPCESNGKVYKPGEVREGPCGSKCTCQEAKWSCTETRCPGICKVEGSSFTTFDDNKFSHPGDCHFLAVHNDEISISVEIHPCGNGQTGSCLTSVMVLQNSSSSSNRYVFNRDGTVTKDGVIIKGYYYSDDVQIFNSSSLYMQAEILSHIKLQIQMSPRMQLYVSLAPNTSTDTVGLCGSFNNKAEDDFMSSQKILESTAQAFANSWEMMPCPEGSPSSCVSIETEKFAESYCELLLSSSGPFAACHQTVNPKFYHEECKKYTCSCENGQDCLCTVLGNYVKACAEKEIYLVGWRDGLCEVSCPSGLVFNYKVKTCNSSCRSLSARDRSCDIEDIPVDGCTCPDGMYQNNEGNCVQKSECDCYVNDEIVQPGKSILIDDNKCVCQDGVLHCQTPLDLTLQNCSRGAEYIDCKDPKAQRRTERTCATRNIPDFEGDLPCKRGCYCPVGMVRNSKGICIHPDDCPCSFGDREYEQGSVTSVGCNECTCIKGSWNCTQNECQSTCHVYGEGHFRTFDGESYSFDGLCQYTFLEDYCGQENGTFRILTESVPCCENGLTCSRKVIVAFQDQNIILQDGKVTAVQTAESTDCRERSANLYSIHTVGLYLIVKLLNGIILIWDKYTKVSVILDPSWQHKVCGLCGNNNGDLKDDFTTRHSSVTAGALEFANSWKTSQECADTVTQSFPCDSNPYCKAWAEKRCEILRDNTFRDCHSKVDPTTYYEACIEEACSCDMEGKYLGLCTAVAMYAEACNAAGVCVSWRKPNLCPVYCDYYNAPGECSWHYEPCGTVTAKTCKDQVIGQKFSSLLEGCYAKCPENAPYLDENTMKCVPLAECSCFYNDVIPAGGAVVDDCGRICSCSAGELECSETPPNSTTTTGKVTAPVSTATTTSVLSTSAVTTRASSSTSGSIETSVPATTSSNEAQAHKTSTSSNETSALTIKIVYSSTTTTVVPASSSAPETFVPERHGATTGPAVRTTSPSATSGSLSSTSPGGSAGSSAPASSTSGRATATATGAPEAFVVESPGATTGPAISTTSAPSGNISATSPGGSAGSPAPTASTSPSLVGTNASSPATSLTASSGGETGCPTGSSPSPGPAVSTLKGPPSTVSISPSSFISVSGHLISTTASISFFSSPLLIKTAGTTGTTAKSTLTTGRATSMPDSTSVAPGVTTSPNISQPVCPDSLPPTPVCNGPLGEEKSPGDVWISNCHQCTCTEAQEVDCKPKECPSPPTCKDGEKLMTFKSNDSCCEIGHCEPRTCLFNNTDYAIGSSFDDPSNPCLSYTCSATGLVAVVQDCPKQTWCAEEERIYDSNKCCYKCKNDCRTTPVNVTIKYKGCRKRVEMARCIGECKRTVKYNYETFQLENSCFCCREENYEFRDIVLDCSDGKTMPYRYRHTTTCSCLDQCEHSKAS